jgi:hypothetical protein
MTTVNEQPDSAPEAGPAGLSLQTDHAKAMVEEIKQGNAVLRQADEAAEAQAEVVVEQAQQLAEAVEDALEELKEAQSGSGHG